MSISTTNSIRKDRWTNIRRDLQHQRSRLIRSVHSRADADGVGTATLGETEHLVVYEQRQLDATLDVMQRHELDRIEAALNRIADQTYGTCVACDAEIPFDRLEAVPTTTTCVGCTDLQRAG